MTVTRNSKGEEIRTTRENLTQLSNKFGAEWDNYNNMANDLRGTMFSEQADNKGSSITQRKRKLQGQPRSPKRTAGFNKAKQAHCNYVQRDVGTKNLELAQINRYNYSPTPGPYDDPDLVRPYSPSTPPPSPKVTGKVAGLPFHQNKNGYKYSSGSDSE